MRRALVLLLAGCSALAASARSETHFFFVRIDGAQQVPPSATSASGLGHLVLDTTAHTLSFHLAYSGLVGTETAAHIHGFAPPGTNAGILYPLPPGSPKIGSVATTPADEASILADLTYVNVHTTTFPAGEIRGQVIRTSRFLLRATLDGTQEVPPLPTPATGTGSWLLDTDAHTLRTFVTFQDLRGPETVAHIHGFAAPGAFAGPLYSLPLGSPVDHVQVVDPAWEPNFLAGLGYVNIHSTVYLNGEIRGQMLLVAPPQPDYVCIGDGSGTPCPCGNASTPSSKSGCAHSFGVGGALRANGFASIAQDTLSLQLGDLPPTTSVLFFQGTTAANGGAGSVFGDGLRCAGGSVVRLGTRVTSAGSAMLPSLGSASLHVAGGVTSPGSRTYQGWFRNSASFCTPSTFNLTNGATLAWEP
jgi:hypothetical protein